MPFPTLSAAAARIYESYEHLEIGDPDNGLSAEDLNWPWAQLAKAQAAPIDQLYDLLTSTQRPWDLAFDGDNAPDWTLPWLSNFTGAAPAEYLGPVGNRIGIRETGNAQRGSVAATAGAARKALPLGADARVVVRERYDPDNPSVDSPYDFQVLTYADETPDADAVLRRLQEAKPGGYRLHYAVVAGWSIDEMLASEATIDDLLAAAPTISALLTKDF